MDSAGWFECPSCKAKYDWLPKQASRRVRCRCSTVLRIPDAPNQFAHVIEALPTATPAAEPDQAAPPPAFELSLESQSPSRGNHNPDAADVAPPVQPDSRLRCTNCGQSLAPGAALCVQCGTPVKNHILNRPVDPTLGQAISQLMEAPAADPQKVSTQHISAQSALETIQKKYEYARDVENETVERARFVDIFLPLILLVLGIAMLATYALGYQPPSHALSIPTWGHLMLSGMNIIVNFFFLLLGLFFVARLFGDAIGSLWITLWKLLGLVVFCVAADAMFYWGLDVITEGFAMLGGYVRIIFSVLVFFPLAGLLLGMDFLQLVVLFLFGRLMPVVVVLIAIPIIYSLFE